MEKHVEDSKVARVYVGGNTEDRSTRRFLTNLSINNVRQINTVKFTCLLNEASEEAKEVTKEELFNAIDKYLDLSIAEQKEILNGCCTFVEPEPTLNCLSFEIPQERGFFDNVKDNIECMRELQTLENRKKFCKNYLEKKQIDREIQSLKMWQSKHRGTKPKNKKKR